MLYAERGAMKNHHGGQYQVSPMSPTLISLTIRVALTTINPNRVDLHQLHKNEEEKLLIDSILLALKEPSINFDFSSSVFDHNKIIKAYLLR